MLTSAPLLLPTAPSTAWLAAFSFCADAFDSTLFVCETGPSFPSLSTRIGTFVFDAPVWVADDSAAASCASAAVWLAVCTPVEPDGQHAPVLPAACDCAADWLDELAFDADALEPTLFVCETGPSLPGLSTRMEMFVLLGLVCAAPDAAPAACALDADCSTVWMPSSGVAAAARLTPV